MQEMRLFNDGAVAAGTYRVDRLVLAHPTLQVYWAHHMRLQVDVVLQVQITEVAKSRLPRAERAIRLLSRVRHPNVIAVLDHWITPDGHPVLVTEFVEGESLSRYMSRAGALDWQLAARVLDGILRALNAMHDSAILHRNVSPDSVYLCSGVGEVVRLGGMTLAKSLMADDHYRRITAAGDTVGLPAYASPEQLLGKEMDPSSDLYSAALLAYEMMAGSLPEQHLSLKHLLQRVNARPPALVAAKGQPAIPRPLEALLMSALEPEPANRPPSASAFLNVLIHVCSKAGLVLGEAVAPIQVGTQARRRGGAKRLSVRSRHPSVDPMRATAGPMFHRGTVLLGVVLSAQDLLRPDTHRLLTEVVGDNAITFEVGQMFWFALVDASDPVGFVGSVGKEVRRRFRHDTIFSALRLAEDFVLPTDFLRGNSPPPTEVIGLLDTLTRADQSPEQAEE